MNESGAMNGINMKVLLWQDYLRTWLEFLISWLCSNLQYWIKRPLTQTILHSIGDKVSHILNLLYQIHTPMYSKRLVFKSWMKDSVYALSQPSFKVQIIISFGKIYLHFFLKYLIMDIACLFKMWYEKSDEDRLR